MTRGARRAGDADETGTPSLAAKVLFLQDGAHLGEPGVRVECIETHFAWVFLTGRYAYKLRKPVRYRDLDTSSAPARRARCLEELRLNRMLAPGVYLDVLPLTIGSDGVMAVDAGGHTIDWLLRMRRLPSGRMFDRLILQGTLRPEDLEALGAHLHAFYRQQPEVRMAGPAYCRRLGAQVRRNRDELLAAGPSGVDTAPVVQVARLQQRWIDTHRVLLGRRAGDGHLRDGHGDLKPEHVCFGPPVSVIDRLEFDADLRLLDPLEDVCFLWLECERLGAPGAGAWLAQRQRMADGIGVPASLAEFYLGNRALTRARLAAWRLAEPGADIERWRGRVADYVTRALQATQRAMANMQQT